MNTTKYWSMIVSATLILSCNNSETKENNSADAEENSVVITAPKYKNPDPALSAGINQIVQHYIHLKNALVKSDSKAAKAGAEEILTTINSVDSTKITGEQKREYLTAVEKIKSAANAISQSAVIEKQREYFNELTEGTYALVKYFSVGRQLFYEYCPMANNNHGGYWISENDEINNPYYGDDMLHCGEVKETVK